MFRIKICYHIKGGYLRARLTSKSINRFIYVGSKYYTANNKDHWDEFIYLLTKKCIEMTRDELLIKYGKSWRKYEQRSQALISAKSAVKRMQPAEIKRY